MLFPGAAAAAPSGGVGVPGAARIVGVRCVATDAAGCPKGGGLARGGKVRVIGQELQATKALIFRGGRGERDNVSVNPQHVRGGHFEAPVPRKARSGSLVAVSALGLRARSPRPIRVQAPGRAPSRDTAPRDKFFFAGRRRPVLTFDAGRQTTVIVQVTRERDGAVVRRWRVEATAGRNRVRWDGRTSKGPARSDHYRFGLVGSTPATVALAAQDAAHFSFYDHIFPIRGRHNFGRTDANGFGGGRGHKGQDVFASCGTTLAAARGGRVKYAGYHRAAGYYVVITGRSSDADYVYMHMRSPARVRSGERVFTGQAIGEVGDTGNASGCHLHFELWTAPGWYSGGRPVDPLPRLREWDSYS